MTRSFRLSLLLAAALSGAAPAQDAPLPIATVERDTPVDFAREIVPFLKQNCFSCHNEKQAKADLNLESPQAMMTGGDSGPALVPGNPAESLVFTYAAHLEDDPMPPAKNKSNAENLSADELALLKLWIEQGAKGASATLLAGPAEWESLAGVHSIYAVAISEDGRFAACGRGNRLSIYDLWTGTLAAELRDTAAGIETAHLDSVHALAFNRHGVLASGGYRNVKLWERHLNAPARRTHALPEAPVVLAAGPDGEWLAAGDSKGHLVVQSLGSPEKAPALQVHGAAVRALEVDPSRAVLYSVSDDKMVARSPLPGLQDPAKVELPSEVLSVALLEGGQKIAVGGADGIIRVLPVTSFDPPAEGASPPAPVEFKGHGGKVLALEALDEAGTQLLSASEDGTARVWDLAGNQVREVSHGAAIVALDAHPASNRFATAGADGIVRIWDATDGKQAGELKGDRDYEIRRSTATRQRDLAKAVAELRRKELGEREKRWDESREKSKVEAGKIAAARKDLAAKSAAARAMQQKSQRLDRDIAALEAAGDPEPLNKAKEEAKKLADELTKADGELANAERACDSAVRNSELAVRDGVVAGEQFLATQAASTDADAALAAAEESLTAIEAEAADLGPGTLSGLAFSPDGLTLALSAEKTGVRLWSATTFHPLATLHPSGAGAALVFSPTGFLIAAFPDQTLATWSEPVTWSKTRQLGDPAAPEPFPDRVLALAFHPRGHLLATGCGIPSRSADLRFWSIRDGEPAGAVEKAHRDTITGLAFSPDGARLASGSTDRFVKIHDVRSGDLLEQLEGHTSHVLDVAWSADGETIASAGADQVAKLWVAAEGRQKKTESGFKKELTTISFLGIGEELLMAGGDQIVKAGGQNLDGSVGFVYDVAASPDGATIVAGGEDGVLRVWQAQDRKLLHSFPPQPKPTETAAR